MNTIHGVQLDKDIFFEAFVNSETATHYFITSTKRPIPKTMVDGDRSYYGVNYFSTEQKAIDYIDFAKRNRN